MKPKLIYPTHLKTKEPKKSHLPMILGILIFLSLAVAIYTATYLEWEDKITIPLGSWLFFLGFVFFISLYYWVNNVMFRTHFGQKMMKKYKLSQCDILDTSNKIVSAVQAIFSCICGVIIILYSCPRNFLRMSIFVSEGYAWFGAAYFFYDIWSMYKVHCSTIACSQMNGDSKPKGNNFYNFLIYCRYNPLMVGHHLFIGAYGFLLITWLRGGLGDCVFGFVFMMELSTPLVSLRGILSRFGLKNSKWYVLNGLVMLIVFFLCRVANFPYLIYLYADFIGKDYFSAIMTLPTGCKISILILLLPQLYWFGLMLKGARKVLRPKQQANNNISQPKKKKTNSHS